MHYLFYLGYVVLVIICIFFMLFIYLRYSIHPLLRDSSKILYDASLFPKMAILKENFSEIQKECLEVYSKCKITDKIKRKKNEWGDDTLDNMQKFILENNNEYWIPAWDYKWYNYPLIVKKKIVPGITREICPKTTELLESIGGIRIAGFSYVKKGGRISPHVDSYTGPEYGSLAYHLCLIGESILTIKDMEIIQKPEKVIIFNPQITHKLYNHTDADRIILYIDFEVA